MTRVFSSVVSLLVVFGSSAIVTAQEAWPTYPLDGDRITRGPGQYFAWWKLLLLWLLYLLWVKTTDWINRDAQLLKLNFNFWNPVNFAPFLLVLLIIALSLAFPIGYTLLVLSWVVPLGAYIFHRNANVEEFQRVLTPDHFRHLFARASGVKTEKKAAHEKGAPVQFKSIGSTDSKNEAAMILARQSEGFVAAKDLVADSLERRGRKIMMDVEAEQVVVRYQIDGVWHEADPLDREMGDMVVEVFKRLSHVEPKERRKRQAGELAFAYKDQKSRASLVSQGTKTGERVILSTIMDKLELDSLSEAGMRDKMQEQLKELLASPSGLLLFCSIPAGGLSTTVALAGKMSDRYMRDFTSFQDINNPEPVAENVSIETFDGKQDSVHEKLMTVLRKDPDVIFVHDLTNKEITELVCQRASEDKLLISTIRAKEAVEALLRVLLLKVSAKTLAPVMLGVVNQRLVRKLCEECKEEYAPSPDLLKKLGIPKGRVESLYRPPTDDDDQPVCKTCGGLGYLGRTSIYELLHVTDELRKSLITAPKLELLRKVAKAGGHRTLQEEGILLVAQGITSLAELQRVLKQ